jgi:transcription antitermination factor NusG
MDTRKTDRNSCEKSPANERSDPKANASYWVAAIVQMNTEKKVSLQLNKLGYHNYLPTQTEIHQWSDRRKKIDRIVIPTIVFVRVDKKEENELRKQPYIYRFISYPGQKEAAIIPDEQIEQLKFMLDNADSAIEFTDCVLEIGDEVEITRGPLKGLFGELCYTEKGKPMIGIQVKMLGYSLVNVDIKDVKRIKKDK